MRKESESGRGAERGLEGGAWLQEPLQLCSAVNSTQRRNGLGAAAGRAGGLAGQLFDWLRFFMLVWMLPLIFTHRRQTRETLGGSDVAKRIAEVRTSSILVEKRECLVCVVERERLNEVSKDFH